nr:hypothetical protein [Tanacetum cinerariifolium]
ADEAAVDLDHVDREFLQITEGRVAGAEVVHRQRQAEGLQGLQLETRIFRRFQQQAFGELQLQQRRVELFFAQNVGERGHQLRVGELLGRDVDRHVQLAVTGGGELFAHAAGLARDPFADRD